MGYSSIRLTAVADGRMGIVGGYDSNQPIIDKLRVINLTATFAGNEPTKSSATLCSLTTEGVKSSSRQAGLGVLIRTGLILRIVSHRSRTALKRHGQRRNQERCERV